MRFMVLLLKGKGRASVKERGQLSSLGEVPVHAAGAIPRAVVGVADHPIDHRATGD
jgi:hypothetical protein